MHSKMIRYLVGCIGLLTVAAALAKDPAQTTLPASYDPTGAPCIDSPRGRTHVLRICGDKHYWFRIKTLPSAFPPGMGFATYTFEPSIPTVSVNLNR